MASKLENFNAVEDAETVSPLNGGAELTRPGTTPAVADMRDSQAGASWLPADVIKTGAETAGDGTKARAAAAADAVGSGAMAADAPSQTEYPATREARRQEMVDGFGQLGRLYNDALNDPQRTAKFQDRMFKLYNTDRTTFMALAELGKEVAGNPPAKPEEIGQRLGENFAKALERMGGKLVPESAEMKEIMSTFSGMMIAGTSSFDKETTGAKTIALVDSFEHQLRRSNVQFVHAIIWNDGEPGMAAIPPGKEKTVNRHKFG